MTIKFACPYCEKISAVPDSFAGKKGKCPACQRLIEVPDPRAAEPPPIPPAPTPATVAPRPPRDAGDAAPAQPQGDTQACRFCGEQIKRIAKKCKFCGEFLDADVRAARRGGAGRFKQPLATPWMRLAARIIDGMLDLGAMIPAIVGIVLIAVGVDQRPQNQGMVVGGGVLVGLGCLALLALTGYQWYLISTRGATLGKGWLGIKIIQLGGADVGFVDGVLLRNWVLSGIETFINMFLPLGSVLALVDALMIFSTDHRTLHDQIASTVVVRAPARPRR